MVVRAYTPDDLAAVVSLFRRSVLEIAARDYTPAQTAAWAPEAPDLERWSARLSSASVFVCEDKGQLAGFARIASNGYVDLLYVHPDKQRMGVARALCDRIFEWAKERGIKRLFTEASVTARPFFERCGFHVVRMQVVQTRGVEMPNLQMERAL